jgi:hypothetical protein
LAVVFFKGDTMYTVPFVWFVPVKPVKEIVNGAKCESGTVLCTLRVSWFIAAANGVEWTSLAEIDGLRILSGALSPASLSISLRGIVIPALHPTLIPLALTQTGLAGWPQRGFLRLKENE